MSAARFWNYVRVRRLGALAAVTASCGLVVALVGGVVSAPSLRSTVATDVPVSAGIALALAVAAATAFRAEHAEAARAWTHGHGAYAPRTSVSSSGCAAGRW
jgi:hypothetical protein